MTYKTAPLLTAIAFSLTTTAAFADVTPLVNVDWLAENASSVDIIDVRSKIGLKDGESFAAGHIPGAVEANYLTAGWRTMRDGVVGVLPETEKLEVLLGSLGVSNEDHVVLVSAGNNATDFGSAARVFWTLKQLGHKKVSILEGGHNAWVSSGKPLSTNVSSPSVETYEAKTGTLNISLDEVKSVYQSDAVQVLDGRPLKQYIGEAKHGKAARAGRIPQSDNLDNHSFFTPGTASLLDTKKLKEIASVVSDDKPVISYCNTGHWASTNWFVLTQLVGKKNVRVYDGSMVEWSGKPELPVATGAANTN